MKAGTAPFFTTSLGARSPIMYTKYCSGWKSRRNKGHTARTKEKGVFPGGPSLGFCAFAAKGLGSIPGWVIKILKTMQPKKKPQRERIKSKEENDGNRKPSVKLPPPDAASVALVLLP